MAEKKKTACSGNRLTIAVLAVTILLLVAAVIALAYLYATKEGAPGEGDFSEKDVIELFDSCDGCQSCMRCLSEVNEEDVEKECYTLSNIFSCVEQISYLFRGDDVGQPCYAECHACTDCLDDTAFGDLDKLNRSLWQIDYLGYFQSPEEIGYTDYNATFDETNDTWTFSFPDSETPFNASDKDGCCKTSAMQLPYTETRLENGITWYPVWFYFPNQNSHKYQWYFSVTCSSDACAIERLQLNYLMTTKTPSERYGYTYKILTLPSTSVKFVYVYQQAYCKVLNKPL